MWFATLHHDKCWGYNSSQDKPNSALQRTQTREEMTIDWAVPFSRGSSRPRNQTEASCISGGFFTSWATTEAQPKGRSFQLAPPVAPSSATVILSLQLLGHHAQGEGEYKVQEGRKWTGGKSLPGRQGRENTSCWVLRGEAESRGHGRGAVTWAAPPFHPPQSGRWGEVLNNQKSLGEISEQSVCFSGKCWDVFKRS